MGTAQQAWEWIGRNLWQIILIGSLFIQVSPIKINPWSTIFKWIGKIIIGETCGKIDKLITKIEGLEKEMIQNEKDRIRWEILDFANSCKNGRSHTQDEFEHIIDLNTKYRQLLKRSNDQNGVFELEYEYLKKEYRSHCEKNDFLR